MERLAKSELKRIYAPEAMLPAISFAPAAGNRTHCLLPPQAQSNLLFKVFYLLLSEQIQLCYSAMSMNW